MTADGSPARGPQIIPLRDPPTAHASGESHITVDRLITQAHHDATLVFGVIRWNAGASSSWSFGADAPVDDGDPRTKRWGASDEAYYVLEGELRIAWTDGDSSGELTCGATQVAYFPRGYTYQVTAVTDARAIYAVAPPIG